MSEPTPHTPVDPEEDTQLLQLVARDAIRQRDEKDDEIHQLKRRLAETEGGRNGRQKPERYQFTDLGNAERFRDQHGDEIRYCKPWKRWLSWTGERWEDDATGDVGRRSYAMVRDMQREAVEIKKDDVRESMMRWSRASQSASKLRAFVSLAEDLVPVLPKDLDRDPWSLNVLNGTIDLRTGELRPHRKEDMITKVAPVRYEPGADCSRWLRCLREVFDGDGELISYFKRAAGYSLTGSTQEQCIFIPWGHGANGKSTVMEVLHKVVGDYGQSMRPDLLMTKRYAGGASEGEAGLKGARFVSTTETGSGQKFDEALVKRLTGSDRIRARFLHANEFEFNPTHKIWLATNHKPVIEGTDLAIWRRIHLIPFAVTFSGDRKDEDLPVKLELELDGILAWLVDGCLEWQRIGLEPPAAVREATETYRSEMDVVGDFLKDCCQTEVKEMQVQSSRLYTEYKNWCRRGGYDVEAQNKFGMLMSERGFNRERRRDGNWYLGIGMKPKDQMSGIEEEEEETPFNLF